MHNYTFNTIPSNTPPYTPILYYTRIHTYTTLYQATLRFSIYKLSDLGDSSNLIGSLSWSIPQYSPPSEWILCELSFFPIWFRERSFKSQQNPRVDFFYGKKRLYCSWVLCSMDCLQLPFIPVEDAVSWTERFLTRTFGPKIEVYLSQIWKQMVAKFYVSSK